jgi:acetyl esterase/lipase
VLRLYNGIAPGSEKWTHKESTVGEGDEAIIINVVDPTIEVFLPDSVKTTGAAMVICPGGAYCVLSYEGEGTVVAKWLAKHGIAGIVLKYRLTPLLMDNGKEISSKSDAMVEMGSVINKTSKRLEETSTTGEKPGLAELMLAMENATMASNDARRAMEIVRENAKQWGIESDKIGIMGFSAGAVLTMDVAMNHDKNSKPNLVVPIYGGWKPNLIPPKDAAPLFICSPEKDVFPTLESFRIYEAWRKANLPAELHYFSKANHGFGANKTGAAVDKWLEMLYLFMKDVEFIPN